MDQQTVEFLLSDLALAALCCGVLALAERKPRNFWMLLVGGWRPGWTTWAHRETSRAYLIRAVRSFAWGFILIAFLLLVAVVMDHFDDRRNPQLFFVVVIGASGLIAGMCFVSGVEQVVRSFLRRNKPAPPHS